MTIHDWMAQRGESAILATAIHNGNEIRDDLGERMVISREDRYREEDPFTGRWTVVSDNRLVVNTSRFEVDLNRPREKAVYRRPEDAWGLTIWDGELPEEMVEQSLAKYDAFYVLLQEILDELVRLHGSFIVYDIHSYNHRRGGADAPPDDPDANPEVNLGTGTLDAGRWGNVTEAFISSLSSYDFGGKKLDVRENVRFKGGHMSSWIHSQYPTSGICLAIEFKKFFMNEWTGEPFEDQMELIQKALTSTVTPVFDAMTSVVSK
ncbi:MAG: N-formylglutamate amidohydrolase [Cyanobacteria bacterium]|nr:N-formylglutamate amidohydrolase [Cyanobacteriota bacterium]